MIHHGNLLFVIGFRIVICMRRCIEFLYACVLFCVELQGEDQAALCPSYRLARSETPSILPAGGEHVEPDGVLAHVRRTIGRSVYRTSDLLLSLVHVEIWNLYTLVGTNYRRDIDSTDSSDLYFAKRFNPAV